MHKLRKANFEDIKQISELIAISAKKLGGQFYNHKTIETALQGAFGVDTQLIKDKTYFVIEDNNQLIGCGGWSYRKTLFGSDSNNMRDQKKLNPKIDAAKIRAFFIHPDFARKGFGQLIMNTCEEEAKQLGFRKYELMSTLSGIDFYQKNDYKGDKYIFHKMTESESIQFLPMSKILYK